MEPLFTPLYDKILVSRDPKETELKGGFLLPKESADKPDRGTVRAVGHGRILENGQILPLMIKPGDRVLFGKYAGTEIKLLGREYLILAEPEIYGVLNPEAEKN